MREVKVVLFYLIPKTANLDLRGMRKKTKKVVESMKFSIDWHEESLRNMQVSLKDAEQEAARALDRCKRLRRLITEYTAQIERARMEGRDSFDKERYNKIKKVEAV